VSGGKRLGLWCLRIRLLGWSRRLWRWCDFLFLSLFGVEFGILELGMEFGMEIHSAMV
jgi:hypothetical protein